MKPQTPPPRMPKGQMKCHLCRKAIMMKDGGWHNRGSQQVFLCKFCEKSPPVAAKAANGR